MNERERFIRTLTCSSPDRPSYGDYLYYEATQKRWEKEGLPKDLNREELFNYFGMDHIDIWDGQKFPVNNGIIPYFESSVVEETDVYTVTKDRCGVTVKVLKNVPPPAMPQFISYPVTDRNTWAEYKKRLNPETPGRLPGNLLEIGASSATRTTPLCAWFGGTYGYIRDWMGVENASYLFYDDPGLVEEMIEHLTYFYETLAKKIFDAGVQVDAVMFWEDMAYKTGSLISPEKYRKYCLRFYKVMVDLVRKNGVKVIMLDSDGNIEELIPIWLDAGINCMHPMEVAAGMDVRTVRGKYGKNVTFLGGIDKRALVRGPAAIDAEVIPKVRELLDAGGGFVVECDHAVPPDISLDNYLYFRKLVSKICESSAPNKYPAFSI
ncbi:MAG: uroporphyrinogen decarboxylase family protein [Candidatus Omnitrophota bacterium]